MRMLSIMGCGLVYFALLASQLHVGLVFASRPDSSTFIYILFDRSQVQSY